MMKRRTILTLATGIVAALLSAPASSQSSKPIPVVASFSIIGDMVTQIGGAKVSVTTLVGPNGDTHVYQPTPADARALEEAKILFVNGLDFEGWIDRLVDASGFKGAHVVTTHGIKPISFEEGQDDRGKDEHHKDDHHKGDHGKGAHHKDDHGKHAHHKDDHHKDDHGHGKKHAKGNAHKDHDEEKHGQHHGHDHGAFDPHAWQSLKHAVVYVDNITSALAKADPANAATYYANRAAYVKKIEALDVEIRTMTSSLPTEKRSVVTSHDAFQYFARDYGLTFLSPQGLSTELEASARDVARLIKQMRKQGISAVFIESISDPRLLEQIANETGAAVGGTLYPGALSGPDGPASTYLKMMRHNATMLAKSLGS